MWGFSRFSFESFFTSRYGGFFPDCTALFQATLYAKSFRSPDGTGNLKTLDELYVKPRGVPHGEFHNSVISANGDPYETFALSIDQLRRLRNSLCHSTSTELDQNMFDQYVNLAKDAFEALSVKTDSIDETLHAELHTLRARVLTCAFFFGPIYRVLSWIRVKDFLTSLICVDA